MILLIAALQTTAFAEENSSVLQLPADIRVIEEQAFYQTTSVAKVIVPENVMIIDSKAFAYSSLTEIELPRSLLYIAEDAFEGCGDWQAVVHVNSYAHKWCRSQKIRCILTEDPMLEAPVITTASTEETSVTLEWTDVANAEGYWLYRFADANRDFPESIQLITGAHQTKDTALSPNHTYWYRVQAYARGLNGKTYTGPQSEAFSVTIAGGENVAYRALLIGNTYPGQSTELPGPDNDLDAMEQMLKLQTATPYQVTAALNQNKENIQQGIQNAFSGADEDDVSLFYFSGHGASNGMLVGTGSTYVSVDELREWLDKVPGKKIVLLDCCYSGMHIGKSTQNSSANPEEAFNAAVISAFAAKSRDHLATDGYTVMTACSSKQQSYSMGSYQNGKIFYYGAFTSAITQGSGYSLRYQKLTDWAADLDGDQNGQTSLEEAYNYAIYWVEDVLNADQSVQYYGDPATILWAK